MNGVNEIDKGNCMDEKQLRKSIRFKDIQEHDIISNSMESLRKHMVEK